MYLPLPIEHQAIFNSDTQNLFRCLGEGFNVYLRPYFRAYVIWCVSTDGRNITLHYETRAMDALKDSGLIEEERPENLPEQYKARYRFTDKGNELFENLRNSPLSFLNCG